MIDLMILEKALAARQGLFDSDHQAAFRLFNGFTEGNPDLAVDLYARTLVFHNYAQNPGQARPLVMAALELYRTALPWVTAAVVKDRAAPPGARLGELIFGQQPDTRIREGKAWYAIELLLNRDASLYLDTRQLRAWLSANMEGKTVLNTFAYTGSLGVAALSGGASRVVQMDRSRAFLNIARESYALNGFPIERGDFWVGDFFVLVGRLRQTRTLFDCVIIDPPFQSSGPKGSVDLLQESQRIINKVRPMVAHNGWLIAINNALFLSGEEYYHSLQELCTDGYMQVETILPIPPDFAGYPQTTVAAFPADPAPFNHPTKIAILRLTRKDKMGSGLMLQ